MKAENRNNSKGDLKMDCSKTIDFLLKSKDSAPRAGIVA